MFIEFSDKTTIEINDYTTSEQTRSLHLYVYGTMQECASLFSNQLKTSIITIHEPNGNFRFVGYSKLQSVMQEDGMIFVCMRR